MTNVDAPHPGPVSLPRRFAWLRSWAGLVRWSVLRHKYLLPAFTAIQALFAVAIVYGLALLIPDVDAETARYLSSGAWTLGIIAVGCVLAPQITGTSKQEGLLDYQRTLPVARSAILLADAIVWNLAALPGIAVGMLAAAFRFGLDIHVDAVTVGYAVAFWLPLTATSLVTQVIMIGGLLFSPITFPAERLPEWASTLHQFLPFAPIGDLVREAAFRAGDAQLTNLLVIAAWTVLAYTTAYLALRKRT